MELRTVGLLEPRRLVAALRAHDTALMAPPAALAAAVSALVRQLVPGRRRIRVSRVSIEWLRAHELESSKHRDNL
jgi:hypothetical protein